MPGTDNNGMGDCLGAGKLTNLDMQLLTETDSVFDPPLDSKIRI